ncbi:hypothetical protein [Streptomyces fagopyri]|uniref:hypothetical protein n=1 Tax=Streptomyces fagopyri TaxID=2662397 RepID=UPI003717F2D7
MSPKLKVMRDRRQDEGAPSRHPRRGVRAAALIVLGGGMVGLWSAPMAQAAGHDSHKTFHSSSTFNFPDVDGGDYQADFKDAADGPDVDGGDDRADFKDGADSDAADDLRDFKEGEYGDAGYDPWDFFDDGFRITVNINNNNNNNNGANANNNNNNNNNRSRVTVNNN